MLHKISPSTLIVAFALIIAQGQIANAQSVPFEASGADAGFDPGIPGEGLGHYKGQGTGTHLGKHQITGDLTYVGDFFPTPDVFFSGTFEGTQTTTAANGDTLELDVIGTVVLDFDATTGLASGTWLPNFTITNGTGRFANATGSSTGVAVNPPFDPFTDPIWPFDWSMTGEIDLGKKK